MVHELREEVAAESVFLEKLKIVSLGIVLLQKYVPYHVSSPSSKLDIFRVKGFNLPSVSKLLSIGKSVGIQ